jgi:hypothetical protein
MLNSSARPGIPKTCLMPLAGQGPSILCGKKGRKAQIQIRRYKARYDEQSEQVLNPVNPNCMCAARGRVATTISDRNCVVILEFCHDFAVCKDTKKISPGNPHVCGACFGVLSCISDEPEYCQMAESGTPHIFGNSYRWAATKWSSSSMCTLRRGSDVHHCEMMALFGTRWRTWHMMEARKTLLD